MLKIELFSNKKIRGAIQPPAILSA